MLEFVSNQIFPNDFVRDSGLAMFYSAYSLSSSMNVFQHSITLAGVIGHGSNTCNHVLVTGNANASQPARSQRGKEVRKEQSPMAAGAGASVTFPPPLQTKLSIQWSFRFLSLRRISDLGYSSPTSEAFPIPVAAVLTFPLRPRDRQAFRGARMGPSEVPLYTVFVAI